MTQPNDQFPGLPDTRPNNPLDPNAPRPSGFPEAQPPSSDSDPVIGAPPPPETKTVADLEREFSERMSGRDRAHAEELKALREKFAADLAAAQTAASANDEKARAGMTDIERLTAENATLQAQLAAERTGRVIDTRKAQFPKAAEHLGDDVLATMEADRLTALETSLSTVAGQPGAPTPLPNTASRVPTDTAPRDMTTDQLKAELERLGPDAGF